MIGRSMKATPPVFFHHLRLIVLSFQQGKFLLVLEIILLQWLNFLQMPKSEIS
jgi:hypothetical protein